MNRPGKLFQKAEPYFNTFLEELDYKYYVENQILPVAARALSVFGMSEKELAYGESLGSLSSQG